MKKINFLYFCILIVFLPFSALLGNVLEYKTTISGSQVFWVTHWYEPILVVSFLFLVFSCFRKKITDTHLLQLLSLVLIIFGIISAVFISPSIRRGFEGFRFTILPVLFFVIAMLFSFTNQERHKLIKIYLIVSSIVAFWAIIERFLPEKYWNTAGLINPGVIFGWGWHGAGGFVQSASFLGGPNQLASYLLPALFIVLYKLQKSLNGKALARNLYLVLFSILFLSIVLTYSRSAIIGMIVGLLVWFIYFSREKFLIYSVITLSVLSIALIWILSPQNGFANTVTHGGQTGHQTALVETMIELKNRTLQKPAELFLGSGLGTAGPLVIKYGNGFISESWYLQLALEIGLFGLAVWLWFMVSILKKLWGDKERGLFLSLLSVSIAAIFLHTWADNPAISYSLFILLGATLGTTWQKES